MFARSSASHRRACIVPESSKAVSRYKRYSKVIIKKPVYQLSKSSMSTALLFLPPYVHIIDIPSVDEHVAHVGKTAVDVALLVLRQGSLVGIELLDLMLVIAIMAWMGVRQRA